MPVLLILLLLVSCSHFKTREQIRAMSQSEAEQEQQGTLTLEDDVNLIVDEGESDQKVMNLYIENAGLATLSAIALLKRLELQEVKIQEIAGQGLGAVISALYQKYEKSSMVEWHLFKAMNSELPLRSGSLKRIEKNLEKMIQQLFGSRQIQQRLIAQINDGQLELSDEMSCHNFYGKIRYEKLICFHSGYISEDYRNVYSQDFTMISLGVNQNEITELSFSDLIASGKQQLESQL